MSRLNRWSWVLVLMLAVGTLATGVACGGGDDDDDGGSNGNGASATNTPSNSDDDNSGDDGGNDNSGNDGGDSEGNKDDLEAFADEFEPPGADETVRFSGDDGVIVSWETDESLDDLKSFVEDKLDDLDVNVQGELSSGDTTSWVFGNDDGSGFQGGVTVAPGSTKTSYVQVTVGFGN